MKNYYNAPWLVIEEQEVREPIMTLSVDLDVVEPEEGGNVQPVW